MALDMPNKYLNLSANLKKNQNSLLYLIVHTMLQELDEVIAMDHPVIPDCLCLDSDRISRAIEKRLGRLFGPNRGHDDNKMIGLMRKKTASEQE
jgi:hypothetical protein